MQATQQRSEPLLTSLTYLFTNTGTETLAHCLDLDIVAYGDSLEAAEESLNTLVLYQVGSCMRNGNFSQLTAKAPFEYWQRLDGASKLDNVHLEFEVPPIVLPVSRSKITLPVQRSVRQALAA